MIRPSLVTQNKVLILSRSCSLLEVSFQNNKKKEIKWILVPFGHLA